MAVIVTDTHFGLTMALEKSWRSGDILTLPIDSRMAQLRRQKSKKWIDLPKEFLSGSEIPSHPPVDAGLCDKIGDHTHKGVTNELFKMNLKINDVETYLGSTISIICIYMCNIFLGTRKYQKELLFLTGAA